MARTSPWPTVLGTAALMALPVLAAAQTSSTSTQTPQTGTATQQPTHDPSNQSQQSSADEHLSKAREVLNSIPRASVTGRNASKLNEVRRHFAALEKSYDAKAGGQPGAPAKSGAAAHGKGAKADWNTHLMALDRALSDLLGAEAAGTSGSSTSSTSTTETTGTSGTSAAGRGTTSSADLEADVRAKLQEFRTHITQFAASASGSSASGSMSSAGSMGSTGSTASTGSTTSSTETTGSTTGTQSTTGTSSTSSTQPTTGTSPSQTTTGSQTSAQGDASVAREHLTKARQSLADLTALPQAQQLQGEARNKVSQLISQFNQLITTQDDWRSAYNEVNATLTALLSGSAAGSSTSGATGTSGSTSTSGAVGTSGASGAVTVDPAVRTKLEEFRTHLQAFYSTAGGEGAGSTSASGSMGSTGSSGSMSSTGSTGSTSPATGSTGSSAYGSQSTTGTSSATGSQAATSGSSSSAETHIAAIERILNEAAGGASSSGSMSGTTSGTTGSATSSTSGTGTGSTTGTGTTGSTTGSTPGSMSGTASGSATASVTLTPAQIQQIRMHLQQLRQSVRQ